MKLISNTLFGKYCKSKEKEFSRRIDYLDWYEKTRNNFDNFLEQPLKLGMFVPCDEEGDILEVPTNYEMRLLNMTTEYNDEVYTYYQAKAKVLFEGFEIDKNLYLVYKNEISIGRFISYENGSKFLFRDNFKTIEDLVEFGFKLTENTIKQIGL